MVKAIQFLTGIGQSIGFIYFGWVFGLHEKIEKAYNKNRATLQKRKEVSDWVYLPIAAVPVLLIAFSL